MSFTKEDTARAKGVGILLLMFHHLFYNPNFIENHGMEFWLIPKNVIQPIAVGARVCVWIFVFLSVYGLTIQYEAARGRETTLQFYVKRWLSLLKAFWPAYIVVFIGYWIVRGNPMSVYENNPIRLGLDAFGIADLFQSPMLTGVWWYMCLAQVIVFIVPLLSHMTKRWGFGSFFLTFVLLQFLQDGIHSKYGGSYLNYLLVAVLAAACVHGALMTRAMKERSKTSVRIIEAFAMLVTAVLLLMIKVKTSEFDAWGIGGFVTGIAAFLIIVLVAKYFNVKCVDRVLRFLGKHSENMFMIHAFLYGPCSRLIFWSHSALLSYITLAALSLLLSIGIELVKKLIRYDSLFSRLTNRLVLALFSQKVTT